VKQAATEKPILASIRNLPSNKLLVD